MNRSIVSTVCLLLCIGLAHAAPPAAKPAADKALDAALPKAAASACALPPKVDPFTFWDSCKDVRMNGCTLEANCRKADGSWRNATFDMNKFPQCYSDFFGGRNLVNRNGTLCCGYAGTPQICGT
ncbi:CVNH domain-containing protein [Lysobacter sp. yr284]|uniref:CVNH domain-containing protein n=1 Tax=Lysobacter TaxID=68 RepID=UPI00089D396C|nr:CVNH domain-containing protein [Lysobacter sp. yr284]SDY90189.1 CVNH domain-containing protein [Lysobacter sp. yr284]